jgi:hypothetical protein
MFEPYLITQVMQNHPPKKKATLQQILVRFSLTMILTLVNFFIGVMSSPIVGYSAITVSDSIKSDEPIPATLLGQWQIIGGDRIGFTSDGKLYWLTESGRVYIYDEYKITHSMNQLAATVIFSSQYYSSLMSIEFIDDTQAHFISSGSGRVLIIQKISDEVGLSSDVHEYETRVNVGNIIRGQQAFFMEHNRFSSTLENLEIEVYNSSFYHYEVRLVGSEQALVTATAKEDGLKSFTGITYLETYPERLSTGSEITTRSKICESEQDSRIPPSCSPDS